MNSNCVSNASADQMEAAQAAGVSMVTHLFNAMPAFHPRARPLIAPFIPLIAPFIPVRGHGLRLSSPRAATVCV
jgi:hypothetical protein